MRKSIFAGLSILEPGESLGDDNGAFTGRDRETIDRLLQRGAKTHRHNGLEGLINPDTGPGVSIVASGGTIPADLAISIGYTLEDSEGGETMISAATVASTGSAIEGPHAAPSAAFTPASGALLVDTYFYATTFTDGEGGETPRGPAVSTERPPGFASGAVVVSQLTFGMEAAGAAGWRLYRATGGGTFNLLATGGAGTDSFVDDGNHSLDCSTHPPAGGANTTVGINTMLVTLPASGAVAGAAFINLYGSITGDFSGGSFLGQYPVASAGAVVPFSDLDFSQVSPPSVNLSIGGAHKIDPDTELLDWHWKRPVAVKAELPKVAEHGDVRLVLAEDIAYEFNAEGEWEELAGSGEGGGGGGSGGIKVRAHFLEPGFPSFVEKWNTLSANWVREADGEPPILLSVLSHELHPAFLSGDKALRTDVEVGPEQRLEMLFGPGGVNGKWDLILMGKIGGPLLYAEVTMTGFSLSTGEETAVTIEKEKTYKLRCEKIANTFIATLFKGGEEVAKLEHELEGTEPFVEEPAGWHPGLGIFHVSSGGLSAFIDEYTLFEEDPHEVTEFVDTEKLSFAEEFDSALEEPGKVHVGLAFIRGMGSIFYGSNEFESRPENFPFFIWQGEEGVVPVNTEEGDWVLQVGPTSAKLFVKHEGELIPIE